MAQTLLAQLAQGEVKFSDVLAFIEAGYTHTPTAFKMVNKPMLQLRTKVALKYFLLHS